MENQNTTHIGKLLAFDQIGYNRTKSVYEKELIPIIETIKSTYESLGFKEPFSQTIFNDLLHSGIQNIETAYEAVIVKDTAKFQSKTLRQIALENADEALQPLAKNVKQLKRTFESQRLGTFQYPLDWNDITIKDSKPVLNEAQVRQKFETRILTERQSELYQQLLEVQAAWNNLTAFLMEHGAGIHAFGFTIYSTDSGANGLVYEADDHSLAIAPDALHYV